MQDWQRAMAMLERLLSARAILPAESERLVSDILRACGHTVTDQGFISSDEGADCFVDAVLDGRRQRLAFEVKWTERQADVKSVEQARRTRELGRVDRVMVISRAGFSPRAQELAKSLALGEVDLLTPDGLRNWLLKHRETGSHDRDCVSIVRGAMRDLARRLAERPEELATIEWRDLERILRETFEVLVSASSSPDRAKTAGSTWSSIRSPLALAMSISSR
jgi:predicted RecB family endonuclease